MTQVKMERRGSVAIIRLDDGVTHALSPEVLGFFYCPTVGWRFWQ
ncbi:MAG: hypothetical protein PVI27_03475 [Desulfobacteraceae bacterium]|jgi:hypothetical protein